MLILASASPRRVELLTGAGIAFEAVPAEVDEEALVAPGDPWLTAEGTALAKARAVSERFPGRTVLGADTVVAVDLGSGWELLGKPAGEADAGRMLGLLSGREHVVVTGVAVVSCSAFSSGEVVASEGSRVRIAMSPAEIAAYVASGEPRGKAGGYALQGGHPGIVLVEGERDNVVGLPVGLVRRMLDASGFDV